MLSSTIFIKSNLKCRFLHFTITYRQVKSYPLLPVRVSRIHQLLSPNPLPLFNSSSPATAQKPLPPIRHICGLGASVGCERIKRTFNTPRLKSQICLIGSNGFVCSSLNELNSNSIDSFPSLVYDKLTLFYLLKGRCPIKEETWFLE